MSESSVSRRIKSCFECANQKDYESALIHFFPALDKTAKKRRPKDGVGKRIRAFIADEEGVISAIALGNMITNINIEGVTFPEAIYKFGRTSIAHEGELDKRLTINDSGSLTIGSVWNLPSTYIFALAVSVMIAPENINERIDSNLGITILDSKFNLNDLWGAKEEIKSLISDRFQNPHIFEDRA